jgi:hypothetical protein
VAQGSQVQSAVVPTTDRRATSKRTSCSHGYAQHRLVGSSLGLRRQGGRGYKSRSRLRISRFDTHIQLPNRRLSHSRRLSPRRSTDYSEAGRASVRVRSIRDCDYLMWRTSLPLAHPLRNLRQCIPYRPTHRTHLSLILRPHHPCPPQLARSRQPTDGPGPRASWRPGAAVQGGV